MGTVLRRLLAAIPLLWGVSTLLFLAIHALPGDVSLSFLDPDLAPDEVVRIRENLGLGEPLAVQYGKWLRSAALLDFQLSLRTQRPVSEILGEVLPNTLLLSGAALFLAFGGGIAAGLFAARREGALPDRLLGAGSILLYSIPGFWLALMLLYLFGERLAILPTGGLSSPNAEFLRPAERLLDAARHLVLPSVALACALGAAVFRFVRASLREALAQEYCRAARARGLPESLVLRRHALRNALLPVVQLFGLYLPLLFGGSVLVETVFGWPGVGRVLVEAVQRRDIPVVLGACFWIALLVVAGNLLADLLSALVDPRVRREA